MRRSLVGIAIGAALVVLAPVIVQRTSDTARTPSASPARTAGATTAAPTPGVAAQISAVDRALVQATQSGTAVPVTLVFTERDLTTSAAAYFPQTMSGVTLTDPIVHLRNGQISLDTTASAAFLRGTAAVVATVGVASGRATTSIVSATVSGATLPRSVTSDIKAQLDQALAAGLPPKFQITTIAVGAGTLTVVGLANP
jgi:hypothetical protein